MGDSLFIFAQKIDLGKALWPLILMLLLLVAMAQLNRNLAIDGE